MDGERSNNGVVVAPGDRRRAHGAARERERERERGREGEKRRERERERERGRGRERRKVRNALCEERKEEESREARSQHMDQWREI